MSNKKLICKYNKTLVILNKKQFLLKKEFNCAKYYFLFKNNIK